MFLKNRPVCSALSVTRHNSHYAELGIRVISISERKLNENLYFVSSSHSSGSQLSYVSGLAGSSEIESL